MEHIYRFGAATLLAALVVLGASQDSASLGMEILVLPLVAFLLSLFILYRAKIIPSLKGRRLLGLAWGFLVALLASYLLHSVAVDFKIQSIALVILIYGSCLLFFISIGIAVPLFRGSTGSGSGDSEDELPRDRVRPKLLDTSVIIDGRIMDIAETKFVEGPFVIPNYVLREIQLISDSSDSIKRNRGRRGLDMLNKLQQRKDIEVKISYRDYTDIREVDAKLTRMAREIDAYLVTNDFNLNKVAALQKVEVLNLNTLTNALKPAVLPGEIMRIDILKEGKDENQGIGYMEDGTMVVVEEGAPLLGKCAEVSVSSVRQTTAGTMIFTKAQSVIEETPSENASSGDGNHDGGVSRRGGRGERRPQRSRR